MAVGYNPKIVTDGLVLCLDAANLKSFSVNAFPRALDIFDWYTTKRGNATGTGCTVERDFQTSRSPAGGIPLKMNVTGNDPHIGSYNALTWNISQALNGQTWRVSVYAKASQTLNNCEIYIFGVNSAGSAVPPGGGWYGITSKTITVTTEWQRFDHFITFNNADIAFVQMRLDGPNSDGAGTTVWWDGLQVELSSLTPFNPAYNENRLNWFDLKQRTNSASLNGYPTFSTSGSGALVFDGTDDYTLFEAGTLGSVITVEMLAKINLTGSRMPFGFTSYDVYQAGGSLGYNTAAGDVYGLTSTQVTNLELIGNWKYYSFVMLNNTNVSTNPYTGNKIYVNAVDYPLSQTTGTQSGNTRTFTNGSGIISGWLNNLTQYKAGMDLSVFKIYNKQLSDSEIQQNFNAIRGRYGI